MRAFRHDSNFCYGQQGMSGAVLAILFDPDDSKTVVSCGHEHIHFWRLHNARLERKSGYFEVQK